MAEDLQPEMKMETWPPGTAPIKKEFLVIREVEVKQDDNGSGENPIPVNDGKNERIKNDRKSRKDRRGIDKNREKKMAKARAEIKSKLVRLCPSVLLPGRTCRYGDKCNCEHSVEKYLGQKEPDLGDKCFIFDRSGKCQYSFACRFGQAHIHDGKQMEKEPAPDYEPLLNTESLPIQIAMRKKQFDFTRADEIVKTLPDKVGAMEREKLRLNMKDLSGKPYLAPLTTVGNLPFRRLCVKLGAGITCSEMAVATSLLQGNPSEWSLVKRHPSEKIFGVQLAGGFPDTMARSAQILVDKFDIDFIDINLGCPLDVVNDKGGGCVLGTRHQKLLKVVSAMNQVMKDVPLTLKFRYGMKEGLRETHHVMKKLMETCPPQLITIHPRSKEQRYTRPAEWDYVPTCAEAIGGKIPLWGCGDIFSPEDYYSKLENYPIDGLMIGRSALIKPWCFKEFEEKSLWDISATERLDYYREFTNYGLEHWGSDDTGVETTRRFFLEWLSFTHRYIPVGLLEVLPPKINNRPPAYRGRNELEDLLASDKSSDWVKITEMFLGKVPDGFLFVPKHKANAY
ncbi:hypothetical protein FO519_008573 [Halicephalobus sp. NKZ332]|nr:hypothetical protein FO519_008573 [Halicephalobus sp. NKZ332]